MRSSELAAAIAELEAEVERDGLAASPLAALDVAAHLEVRASGSSACWTLIGRQTFQAVFAEHGKVVDAIKPLASILDDYRFVLQAVSAETLRHAECQDKLAGRMPETTASLVAEAKRTQVEAGARLTAEVRSIFTAKPG